MIWSDLTALEALGVAVRREMDAGQIFRILAASCASPTARERFQLLDRESRHQETLVRERHAELFPAVALVVPPSVVPLPEPAAAPDRCQGLLAALRFAADVERSAREFYLEAATITTDLTAQAMFRYLADIHGRRRMELEAEYDLVLRYPHAFDDAQAPWRPEARLRKE